MLQKLHLCAKRMMLVLAFIFCAHPFQLFAQEATAELALDASLAPMALTSQAQEKEIALRDPLPPASSEPHAGTSDVLAQHGITFGASYYAEVSSNANGGLDSRNHAALLGSVIGSVSVDLAKLGIGRGQAFVSAQNLHGGGFNDTAIGAAMPASNLDAPQYSRVIEAWYADSYFHDKLRIKVGRQYADYEFGGIENGANFLNAAYGVIPTAPMPTYPLPSVGVVAWVAPTSKVSVGAGVYRGQMLDAANESALPSRKGAFKVVEVKLEPFGKSSSQSSTVRLGVWHQNGGAWKTDAAADSNPVSTYGAYAAVDYWFHKRSDDNRGPGLFARWGWAPADRNQVHGYWSVGIDYAGVYRHRAQDSLGVGVMQVKLQTGGSEAGIEAFYKIKMTKHMTLQPDLQWIQNPSGRAEHTMVAGCRIGFEF